MKTLNDYKIIGIDHGYGNMKTANCCFPTGVIASDTEPPFTNNLLVWNNKYYSIGVGHKEFTADKFIDEDYYILTLAAIARELNRERITDAKVFIAAGLPLTWVTRQKEEFKKYLLQHRTVDFNFRRTDYHIEIIGADVFPQGFAAIAETLGEFKSTTMLCDIGNGTMNLLKISDRKPDMLNMFTEKYGVYQCTLAVREAMMREHHTNLDESIITEVLKKGTADIDGEYLNTIITAAKAYTAEIFRKLREHDYNPKLMKLYVVGGGGCLIRHFGEYDKGRVFINSDICATAKGYEYIAYTKLSKNGGAV